MRTSHYLAIRRLFFVFIFFCAVVSAYAQADPKKIIPPSPTTSALAKYGDIPVSLYTGTPNISIPLYEISTGDFSLPISLSYQASGIKVEDIASWVGLGWSLNAGGIISRSVRGLPDELNGYLDPGTGEKVSEVLALPQADREIRFMQIAAGISNLDLEPDLFFFNFAGVSGKFYYSQESGKFICVPQNTISFDRDYFLSTGKWKIKTEDGTEYHFDLKEQNTNFTACNGSTSPGTAITTGWFLTKIITPVSRRVIDLLYESANYVTSGIVSTTLHTTDGLAGLPPCVVPMVKCYSNNEYTGQRLLSIVFNGGHVDFKSPTNRYDVHGDKRLDAVEVFRNGEQEPFRKFTFDYDYFNKDEIIPEAVPSLLAPKVRLKLKSVTQHGEGQQLPPHLFEYDESSSLPSRDSFAQDHWGFYNGVTNNEHLVPPYKRITPDATTLLPGANRITDPKYATLGLLTKMTYPTGGSTAFRYENHTVPRTVPFVQLSEPKLPKAVYLDQMDVVPGSGLTNRFEKKVVLDDHMAEGVFVSFNVSDIIGCSICPTAQACAVITLESATYSVPITCNVKDLFVPNGEYTLKADFSAYTGDPSGYLEFVVEMRWSEYVYGDVRHATVGGVRIAEIVDEDGAGRFYKKLFDYTAPTTHASSGELVSFAPVYEYRLPCDANNDPVNISSPYIVRKSYSNVALGTTQGSHIGYSFVTVTTDEAATQGKTIYQYSAANTFWDVPTPGDSPPGTLLGDYPFGPSISYDHRRGKLLRQEDYKKEGDNFVLVRSIINEYDPFNIGITTQTPEEGHYNQTIGVRVGVFGSTTTSTTLHGVTSTYKTISEWVRLKRTITEEYDGASVFSTETLYEYGNYRHRQLTKVTTLTSDGASKISYMKYPLDYSIVTGVTDNYSKGVKNLIDNYILNEPVEHLTTILQDGHEYVTAGLFTHFSNIKNVPLGIQVLKYQPSTLFSTFPRSNITIFGYMEKSTDYEERVSYTNYDSFSNLLGQSRKSDTKMSYVWGYNNMYPVAEVTNASSDQVYHSSFEENGVAFVGTDGINRSKSGVRVYEGSTFAIPSAFTPPGTNIKMSYWYWKSDKWNYSGEVPFSYTIQTTGTHIDEVRVYPAGAQMTTYTYLPLTGVSSKTDANGVTVFYEYDSFGRLKFIRDSNGDILNMSSYHYKDQN